MNRTCGTLQRFQCFLKFKCCRCITTVVFTTSTKKGSNGCTSTVFCTVRTVGVRLCTWRNVNGSITEPHLRISMNFSTFKIQALLGRWRCKNSSVLHLWGLDNHLQYLWHIDDLPIKQSLNRHFKDHPWVFPQQGERDQCCRTNVLCVNPGAKVLRGTRRLETVHAHDGRVWKVATCLAVRQLHWPTEFNSPSPGSASRRRTEEHAISSCSGSCRPCAARWSQEMVPIRAGYGLPLASKKRTSRRRCQCLARCSRPLSFTPANTSGTGGTFTSTGAASIGPGVTDDTAGACVMYSSTDASSTIASGVAQCPPRALGTAGRSSLKLETWITCLNHFLPLGERWLKKCLKKVILESDFSVLH